MVEARDKIEGGSFALRGGEASMAEESQVHQKEMALMETVIALLGSRLELLNCRIAALKVEEKPDSKGDARGSRNLIRQGLIARGLSIRSGHILSDSRRRGRTLLPLHPYNESSCEAAFQPPP